MKSEQLIEKLKKINKSFYNIADLEKITGQSRSAVRVLLGRLVLAEKLIRLRRDIYVIKDNAIDYRLIAQQIDDSSYVSFESALAEYGILSQIPYALILATNKKSKTIFLGDQEIIYRKIKKDLFGGYVMVEKIKIATPEKALLDLIYLKYRGKSKLSLEELDLDMIDKNELIKLSIKYPNGVKKIVKSLK
jgi:predicted transcriptional regulator of viral defense system